MEANKRILLACPVRDREYVLPYYLNAVHNLDYPKKLISIYWVVNNSKDQSQKLLEEFKKSYEHEYESITIEIYNNKSIPKDERQDKIRKQVYPWLAELRNKLLKKTVKINADYLFSSDCDIIFKADALRRLIEHNLPVVSGLIYNGMLFVGMERGWEYPNILKETQPRMYQHIKNYRTKNPEKNPVGTLIETEFTGAIILIAKEVCAVTKYDSNPTYGEDEPWSYDVRQHGWKMFCDVSVFSHHAMNENVLNYYIENKMI